MTPITRTCAVHSAHTAHASDVRRMRCFMRYHALLNAFHAPASVHREDQNTTKTKNDEGFGPMKAKSLGLVFLPPGFFKKPESEDSVALS